MPRLTKSSSAPSKEVSVSSIISDNIQLSNVESTTPIKAPRAKKPKALVVETVSSTVESTITPTPSTELIEENIILESVVALDADPSLIVQSNEFFGKLQQLGVLISSIKTEYRSLEKKWSRDLKAAQKKHSKGKRKLAAGNQTRAPSGFVKPTLISDELAAFLGKEKGTEMARTAVTRDINAYIRSNSLQDTDNGRKIIPDSKLATLLKLNESDELTYFNLQKYMSPHFQKNVKVDIPVVAVQQV